MPCSNISAQHAGSLRHSPHHRCSHCRQLRCSSVPSRKSCGHFSTVNRLRQQKFSLGDKLSYLSEYGKRSAGLHLQGKRKQRSNRWLDLRKFFRVPSARELGIPATSTILVCRNHREKLAFGMNVELAIDFVDVRFRCAGCYNKLLRDSRCSFSFQQKF